MANTSDKPITLVVRRGALRRFHKLQKETANLPVVVTWDRRQSEEPRESASDGDTPEERRKQPSFTWELADFAVVPPSEEAVDPAPEEAESPAAKRSGNG